MRKCFVICPLGDPGTRTRQWSDFLLEQVIRPAAKGLYDEVERTVDSPQTGDIVRRLHRELREADIVVADLSDANANVAYELGLRHAFGKPYALLSRADTEPPFDLRTTSIVFVKATHHVEEGLYRATNIEQARKDLRKQIESPVPPPPINFAARAFDWTTTYAPHVASHWLERQDAETQKQLRDVDADERGVKELSPSLVSSFGQYRALKRAANQRYKGYLYYYVNPLDLSVVDGHAIYRFATETSIIEAAGREEGRCTFIRFEQPPRQVEEAGLRITLPGFEYSVDFRRGSQPNALTGELNHPDTDTFLGKAELHPRWGLGI